MRNIEMEGEMIALRDSVNSGLIRDELYDMVNQVRKDIAAKRSKIITCELDDEEMSKVAGGVDVKIMEQKRQK